jgi:glycosyltransferase involved in cell wall biosynthesis
LEKVSVIIPCYNYGLYLSEAIESIIAQTYSNWECLIIDDGSTDNTKEVSENYCNKDKRIHYFSKINGGLSSARNEGLKHAKGDFIQFLDADDFIDKNKFNEHLELYKTKKETTVFYSDYNFFFNDGTKKENHFDRMELLQDAYTDFVLNWGFDFAIPIHCGFFKRELIQKNNIGFDETLKAREDWLFWIELAKNKAHFNYTNKVLAYYRKHNDSMVHDSSHMFKNTMLACFKVHRSISEDLKNKFEIKYVNYLSNIAIKNNTNTPYKKNMLSKLYGFVKIIKPAKK